MEVGSFVCVRSGRRGDKTVRYLYITGLTEDFIYGYVSNRYERWSALRRFHVGRITNKRPPYPEPTTRPWDKSPRLKVRVQKRTLVPKVKEFLGPASAEEGTLAMADD